MSLIDRGVGRDGLRRPRGNSERGEEYEDEGEDSGNEEEAKHPMRGDTGDLKRIGDVRGEGNCIWSKTVVSLFEGMVHTGSPRKQFVQDNLKRIEPIHALSIGAMRNTLIGVSFTEIP